MLNSPLGVDIRAHPVQGADLQLAQLHQIVNASGHGVRGVVFGEGSSCLLMAFQWEWPNDIKSNIVSPTNWGGKILNSDLKMASLLLLWLVIEGVRGNLHKK